MKKLLILTILCSFITHIYAKDFCSEQKFANPNFLKLEKDIVQMQDRMANHKVIASKADKLLLTLIAQRSPMITGWIKKRKFDPAKDDLKIAKEWRKYFFNNFILRVYPLKEKPVDDLIERFFYEVNMLAFPKKTKTNLQNIFKKAQALAIKKVDEYKLDKFIKEQLISKIEKIKLYFLKDLKTSKYKKQPMEFINWGIAYDPINNEINIGVNTNKYSNTETLMAVFLHEIAHSFDPCWWSRSIKAPNPFKKVIACLRNTTSVGAKKRDDSLMKSLIARKRLTKKAAYELKNNPTCNKSNYPPIGLQKDQAGEAFADWFAADAIASSKYVSNLLRNDLCTERKLIKGSSYLKNIDRLQKLYHSHPIIRKRLKIKSPKAAYCRQ